LVDALQAGGSWAPIAPLDSVDIWLDSETWFPLRFEVSDGTGTVLEVTATSVEEPDSLSQALFETPRKGVVTDGGFVQRDVGYGYIDLHPRYVAGLKPFRSGVIKGGGPTIFSYASGMTWLKVMVGDSKPPDLATQLEAEVVALANGGRALYQPADGELERRLDVDEGGLHFHLESNLPRDELLRVGSSLPIEGKVDDEIAVEGGTVRRLTAGTKTLIDFAKQPTYLPAGYRQTGSFLRTGRQRASIERFSLPESDLGGAGIQIDQSPSLTALPPSSEDLFGVRIGQSIARWSEERGQLEWIDGSVYRSIAAPSFDWWTVVKIARSMR
jgi:hypothetical protein